MPTGGVGLPQAPPTVSAPGASWFTRGCPCVGVLEATSWDQWAPAGGAEACVGR